MKEENQSADAVEQEPVAWVDEEGRVVRVSEDGSGDGGWVSGHDRAIPDSWTPLHPAKPAALPACCRKAPCEHPPGVGPCDKPAAQPQGIVEKYNELLYHVARAFPDESRHETALRYIKNAESAESYCAAAKEEGECS